MKKGKVSLTTDDVKHLAKLARLQLSDEEIKKYQRQLEETIDYIHNLDELNTEGVSDTFRTSASKDVYYKDGSANPRGLTQEEATKNAKNKKNGLFVVKRII